MNMQGQDWLRGALIVGGIAAVGIILKNRGGQKEPQEQAAAAVGGAVETVASSDLGQRGAHIGELILGNITDNAMGQVKMLLRDALKGAEAAVDEL